jgi:hypothetical protein
MKKLILGYLNCKAWLQLFEQLTETCFIDHGKGFDMSSLDQTDEFYTEDFICFRPCGR